MLGAVFHSLYNSNQTTLHTYCLRPWFVCVGIVLLYFQTLLNTMVCLPHQHSVEFWRWFGCEKTVS